SMYPDFKNAAEGSWSFTINKPIWKENWFLTIAVFSGFLLGYLIIKQREKNLKNIALLKHQRIMFEYEHLKSQVNPHFLFNSLNTLTNLIARDKKKAIDYTENLSYLYHSILAYHDNDLVLLSEEMNILENYFSIQKGRFGDALQLHIDIPNEVMREKKIVPLALQILIENVIKHNVITGEEPLIIYISANENEITIRNLVYPKISKEKGEGIGLINIKKRYELLTKKPVTYGLLENEFVVILPLL
ncbi:MAG: sensor histidine kinase, partial [Sphingobacteriales bacterium]